MPKIIIIICLCGIQNLIYIIITVIILKLCNNLLSVVQFFH